MTLGLGVAVIKSKYHANIPVEQEVRVSLSDLMPGSYEIPAMYRTLMNKKFGLKMKLKYLCFSFCISSFQMAAVL